MIVADDTRRSSEDSDASLDPAAREFLSERIAVEEDNARREEIEEIRNAEESAEVHGRPHAELDVYGHDGEESGSGAEESNTEAALREAEGGELVEVEDRMAMNAGERQRLRKQQLGQRLMEVFGLNEMEEVVEEMRCWLLRSVSE